LKALDVLPKLTPEVVEKIEKILDNKPEPLVSPSQCLMQDKIDDSPTSADSMTLRTV